MPTSGHPYRVLPYRVSQSLSSRTPLDDFCLTAVDLAATIAASVGVQARMRLQPEGALPNA